jgi:type II secretory pathway component PulF
MNLLLFLDHDPATIAGFLVLMALFGMIELLLAGGILYVFYFLLTLPMRRNERARLFLDLLELGLKDGFTAEKAILDAASSRDRSVGARFHLLAAHLEKGRTLGEGLARVPHLISPQISAMLRTGERIGDIMKVLPACRQMLSDGVSQVRGALNYLLILTFLVTPSTILVPMILAVVVLPKFKEVFAGVASGSTLPAFTAFVFDNTHEILWVQGVILLACWIVMIGYLGGPRLRAWLRPVFGNLPDRLLYRLPWRRKRLQRDFSAMLAVLLDSAVPEIEAVALAAEATTNASVRSRANKVCNLLTSGIGLPQAVRTMDDSGELQWRLANAFRRSRGFLRALAGWHEALDAKAFQLEQTAAQLTTSAMVLFNGTVVAGIVIAIFVALLQILDVAVLW